MSSLSLDSNDMPLLQEDNSNGHWFDRSLEIKGLEIVVAGAVGGQSAVPDQWAYKVRDTIALLIDSEAVNINLTDQQNLITTLAGDSQTWHAGMPTAQRIARGSGEDYSPNPLYYPESYEGYDLWLDNHMHNDMIWYQNSSHGDIEQTVDNQINEVLEHLMHTIHVFGVRGAVTGSYQALMGNDEEVEASDLYRNQDLYLAMVEAIDNEVFNPDYFDAPDYVLLKEYTYLLNFNMWEFGLEFWDDDEDGLGSLAPEWSDSARTPAALLQINPLGYNLFQTYFEPVLSRPEPDELRAIYDMTPPSSPVINTVTDDDILTADELSTFSGISGTAEAGSTISITSSALSIEQTTVSNSLGIWLFQNDTLGLSMSVADGTYVFTITATDLAGNASLPSQKSLELSLRQTGISADGAISTASVSRVDGSNQSTSALDGSYTALGGAGSIVAVGGQDSLANRPFKGVYTSLSDSTMLSPLTTLVHQLVDAGADSATAITRVTAGLGLSSSFSLDSGIATTELDSGDTTLGRDTLGKIAMVSLATQLGSSGDPMLGLQLYNKLATAISTASDSGQAIDLTDMAALASTFGGGDYSLSATTIQTIQTAMLELNLLTNDGSSTLMDFSTKLSDLTASLTNNSFGVLRFWNSDTDSWKLLANRTIKGLQNETEAFSTSTSDLSSIDFSSQNVGSYNLLVDGIDTSSAINITDAVSILKDIVGLTPLSGFAEKAADVNGDSQVNISDAVSTLKMIVGLEDAQPPVIFDHLGQSEITLDGSSNYDLYAVILGDVDGSGVSLL